MLGYSGTPLARKLGVKEGYRVALVTAPEGFGPELEPLPAGVIVSRPAGDRRREIEADIDLVVLFVTRRRPDPTLPGRRGGSRPAGALWVAWPKRASKVPTDLTEDVLREVCLPLGWVDTKVCAVTEVWSGLKFVLRKENRPGRRVTSC